MPEHAAIFEALSTMDAASIPGIPADGPLACEGAKFHSPSPLLLHEIELADDRKVILCGVCRDNLDVLRSLMIVRPTLPWAVRREFGNRLRALVPMSEDPHG